MKYSSNNEYYIVDGWYNNNGGMYNGSFFGAMSTSENYLALQRVVMDGSDAKQASDKAKQQIAMVFPAELHEDFHPCHDNSQHDFDHDHDHSDHDHDLTPRDEERTEHMLLDNEWGSNLAGMLDGQEGVHIWINGNQIVIGFGSEVEDAHGTVDNIQGLVPDEMEVDWDYDIYPGDDWKQLYPTQPVNEMTSSGGIAMGPMRSILDDPYVNKSRLGLGDRGGHGRADGLGTQKPGNPKPGTNFIKSKKPGNYLKGIGTDSKTSAIHKISQGRSGRRGGARR